MPDWKAVSNIRGSASVVVHTHNHSTQEAKKSILGMTRIKAESESWLHSEAEASLDLKQNNKGTVQELS